MTGDTYPLCTVWVAPCDRCGADVLTDEYLANPYFGSGCECGGWPDAHRAVETVEVIP